MSIFVIWIDREHAKIFEISEEKMERKSISAKHVDHHTHEPDSLDYQRREKSLFAEAIECLKSAGKILILGPGVAKYHFQAYLMEHFPALARKIKGCETVDHPTDGQIADLARRHFEIQMLAPIKRA